VEQTLNIAKALADGSRMRVIAALMSRDELCVCQITEMLQLAPATVSRHMTILQHARLVQSRKEGRWVFYRLTAAFPDLLYQWLTGALADSAEIRADRGRLQTILACDPDDLCRRQKNRKSCRKS
jgi:ArsR family transcriptional regulator